MPIPALSTRCLPAHFSLLLLLTACTAEIGEPVDHHGGDEEEFSIERTNQRVGDFESSTCSTSSVAPLSAQIAEEMLCMAPGVLVKLSEGGGLTFRSSAVLPYMDAEAAADLRKAAAVRPIELTSGFRSVAQQYLLHRWRAKRRCGISAAATPGNSNHESGRAIDVANRSSVRTVLRNRGWKDHFANDPVHFEHRSSPDMRGLDVHAFQRLWNRNHPNDQINEDGDYGATTASRLRKAPAAGFLIGPECNGSSSTAWIGDSCEDDTACELPFVGGSCEIWPDIASPNTSHGMCVAACTGFCPERAGEVSSFCADLGGAEGSCVPLADASSADCSALPGTEAITVRRFDGPASTSASIATVCAAPLHSAIECSEGTQSGECVNTELASCSGALVTGACPGPSAIRCCLAN